MTKNETCMNCGSRDLHRFIDLGSQPNGNHFPERDALDSEPKFPFAMLVCKNCWQVQIEEFPPVEFMFANHPYITGVNMPVLDHFTVMARRTVEKFGMGPNSLVLDIGCNDGTLIRTFNALGMQGFGIDPGQKTGALCRKYGTLVFETFWTQETAHAFRTLNCKPDLITATAVFYHIADLHGFVRGLSEVMTEKTVFLTQCVYLLDVLNKNQFDHFYHEHTLIHSLAPLERLFAEHGLRMLDVDFYPVHGGSFVLYVGREESPHPTRPSIADAIAEEKAAGLQEVARYDKFAEQVRQNREDLVNLLKDLKSQGKRVFALGAPLKGSTLLNYCDIGPDLVECATEVNEFKIGRYTPGTHIPIIHESEVKEPPDYYLLLSWNFLDFFRQKYFGYLRRGGRFIVPHPKVSVISE